MGVDALGDMLKRDGVIEALVKKKGALRESVASLINAYKQFFPDAPVRSSVLEPLIWNVLRWDNTIRSFFLLHDFDLDELDSYCGPIAERVVFEALKLLETDLGDIKLKPCK